jgi:hypothetical protein
MKTYVALFLAATADAQFASKSSKAESLSYSLVGVTRSKSSKSDGRVLINVDEIGNR